ncbi:MAG TPA: glycosyltransferase family 39 protein, partial [Ktedonobacterales bacterium]|nr:glycosyltransferase family 39 protein [Ktedonobacterales bacterium]
MTAWEVGTVCAVLLLALLLRLWHLSALTDNYDEGVYWSSLRAMHAGNGLFTPVFSSQPPFFLLSLYPLVALFGPTLLAARLGVVLLSLLGILGMYLLARRLGGPWTGAGAALLLASDYLFLMQSQTIEAEAPSVALMIAAVAAAAYADRYPWQAALVSGVATSLAMLEKLFAVGAIVPILALFVGYLITFEQALPSEQEPGQQSGALARLRLHRQTVMRSALLAGAYLSGLALAGLLVLLPYLNQLQAAYQQVIAFHLTADQTYASTLSQNAQTLLGITTEYPLALLALLGIILGLVRRRWLILVAVAWTLAALVVLLRQSPLFTHHVALLVPALALSAAIGLAPAAKIRSTGVTDVHDQWRGSGPAWKIWSSKLVMPGLVALLLVGMLAFNLGNDASFPLGMEASEMNPPPVNATQIAQVAGDLQRLTTPQQQVITDDQYIAA